MREVLLQTVRLPDHGDERADDVGYSRGQVEGRPVIVFVEHTRKNSVSLQAPDGDILLG